MVDIAHTFAPSNAQSIDPTQALLLDDTRLMRMAYEIARQLYSVPDIVKLYGLTEELFNDKVKDHPRFLMFFSEGYALWNNSHNVAARTQIKSAFVFETWLKEANRLMHDPHQPMGAKVDLGKFLATIGGIVKEKGTVQAGERTVININFSGGRSVQIDKEIPKQIEGEVVSVSP